MRAIESPPIKVADASVRPLTLSRNFWIIALLLLHLPLAVLYDDYPSLAQAHAVIILVGALWVALIGNRADRVAYATAYVAGAEVLWRMVGASVPWEFAKYAISLVLLIGVLRFFRQRHMVLLPILFVLALLPSVLISYQRLDSVAALRDALSFNLSGPFSLAIAAIFFLQLRASRTTMLNILWSIAIPITAIAARVLHSILASDLITFTDESNFQTSGGFGPNQVSAILGLGALVTLLLAINERQRFLKLVSIGLFFWFTTHSFLTFSRGGIYSLVIAAAVAMLVSLRTKGRRIGAVTLLAVILGVMGWFVLPRLEEFTQDRLKLRFTSADTTQRAELARAELSLWRDNPLSGIGPGGATAELSRSGGADVAAHTEFTRLLAEHGIGGLIALGLLITMAFRAWRRTSSAFEEVWCVAFLTWSLVEMGHSAMRLAAIGFCFGLAMMQLRADHSVLRGR